jgi:flavin-dependent dehydrogenase
MDEWVEVAVVGGGPAGTAAAIGLGRAGRLVALLERSAYGDLRVGETLAPIAQLPLARLGVWEQFIRDGHAASPGTVSAWGQPARVEEHHILSPYGSGWHLDRRRFDRLLAQRAEAVGAQLFLSACVTACQPAAGSGWQIDFTAGGRPRSVQSAFLIDATGRRSSPARQPGSKRIGYDRLVGLIAFLATAAAWRPHDPRTLVEAVEDGWWYSAWLPNSQLVVAYMTDADLVPKGRAPIEQHWRSQLEQARHTHARAKRCQPETGLITVSAATYRTERAAGERWLAAGDAAMAYDPLSSLGICTALESGLQAAAAIDRCLAGDPRGLEGYAGWLQGSFAEYLRMRARYYDRERRWPRSVFWRRRHAAGTRAPPAYAGRKEGR